MAPSAAWSTTAVNALQDAVAAQPVDAALDRGGRQRHAAGDVVVGAAAVLDQQRKNPAVDVVHALNSCTKSRGDRRRRVVHTVPPCARSPRSCSTRPTPRRGRSAPSVAAEINPSHPADSSYARAAELLRAHDFAVDAHAGGALDRRRRCWSSPTRRRTKWERVVPGGSPVFSRGGARRDRGVRPRRRRADRARRGGAGEVRHQPRRAGRALRHRRRQRGRPRLRAPPPGAELGPRRPRPATAAPCDLLARVARRLLLPRRHADHRAPAPACWPARRRPRRRRARRCWPSPSTAPAASWSLADSDLFGDDCIDELGHADLWRNLVHWAARPAAGRRRARGALATWRATRTGIALQEPHRRAAAAAGARRRAGRGRAARRRGGHVDGDGRRDRGRSRRASRTTPTTSRPWSPTCAPGRRAASPGRTSPRRWTRFRPDQHRADGIEHLVVFPMYLQNSGSRDTHFEALIVRVPWPEWIAELEATRYDNAKFVPVEFVDHTRGYDSESAVLFPETVAIAGAAGQPLRRRSSATARPRASAASARRPRSCCGSTCRPTPPRCCPARRCRATRSSSGTSSTTAPTATATCRSTRS